MSTCTHVFVRSRDASMRATRSSTAALIVASADGRIDAARFFIASIFASTAASLRDSVAKCALFTLMSCTTRLTISLSTPSIPALAFVNAFVNALVGGGGAAGAGDG
eukprot:30655-Pelagococcus_subviridis.AAC.21